MARAEERFWAKVDTACVNSECWLWTGATNGRYGMVRRGAGSRTSVRRISAHRYAYELTFGQVPENRVVMHTCDNPICVRPTHLSVATQADNLADMRAKGRAAWQGGSDGK
jgi:hypothetical protein